MLNFEWGNNTNLIWMHRISSYVTESKLHENVRWKKRTCWRLLTLFFKTIITTIFKITHLISYISRQLQSRKQWLRQNVLLLPHFCAKWIFIILNHKTLRSLAVSTFILIKVQYISQCIELWTSIQPLWLRCMLQHASSPNTNISSIRLEMLQFV